MAEIKLVSGETVLLDEEDFEAMSKFTWYLSTDGYAMTCHPTQYMHRLVMKTPKGMECDHWHHNKLDNRKSELRNTPKSNNQRNRLRNAKGTSKFKGVCLDKARGTWKAQINLDGQIKTLGRYGSQEKAAAAYDAAALETFGEFAHVNGV